MQIKVSRSVAYALRATLQLAVAENDGSPVTSTQLASEGRMPEQFLGFVLRNLVARGILKGVRGPGGGYCLQRRAEEISLLEVIEAIDGKSVHIPSLLYDGLPEHCRIKLQSVFESFNAIVRRELGAVKLSQLLPLQGTDPAVSA